MSFLDLLFHCFSFFMVIDSFIWFILILSTSKRLSVIRCILVFISNIPIWFFLCLLFFWWHIPSLGDHFLHCNERSRNSWAQVLISSLSFRSKIFTAGAAACVPEASVAGQSPTERPCLLEWVPFQSPVNLEAPLPSEQRNDRFSLGSHQMPRTLSQLTPGPESWR